MRGTDIQRRREMAYEEPLVTGRRRSRGAEATARAGALERLKALRSGGRRSESGGFHIKMEDPIYDTVADDEYEALVAKRREEVRGFIVDDDGLGYGDEGEEEDWSRAELPLSSDESDGEPGRSKRKKVEKKEPRPKKPSSTAASLSAAAAMMGKQRLSSMFTSSVFKARDDRAKGLSCDSIVDDVIAEFAPDDADRERRRRGHAAASPATRNFVPIVKAEKESTGVIHMPGSSEFAAIVGNDDPEPKVHDRDSEEVKGRGLATELGSRTKLIDEVGLPHDSLDKGGVVEEKTEDVVEMKAEPAVKEKLVFTLNAKIKEEKDPALSAIAGWQAVRSGGTEDVGSSAEEVNTGSNNEKDSGFDLDSDGSLPFYMLDAHEEFYGANVGTLYLFGKVTTKYKSCSFGTTILLLYFCSRLFLYHLYGNMALLLLQR